MTKILACIDVIFADAPHAAQGNYFVAYAQNDSLTESLSMACDQRIVWGGNETVARLRAIPMNPHAGERSFASKRSLSVLNAEAFTAASTEVRQQLADAMVMDILPFGQLACSSPHTVYWLHGNATLGDNITAFGEIVQDAFVKRSVGADLGWAVRRLNTVFEEAARGRVIKMRHAPHSTQYLVKSGETTECDEPCGAGLLAHASCQSIAEFGAFLGPRHQTITHFGLSSEEQDNLAWIAGCAGVDRVVPVGKALGFSARWDGFNLWDDLTRTVDLQR